MCAKEEGGYVVGLFACDRTPMPEEEVKRGGTEKKPITEPGNGIFIHSVPTSDTHVT